MEEISGGRQLHKESWSGPKKGIGPTAGLVSVPFYATRKRRSTAKALQIHLQQAIGVHVSNHNWHEGLMSSLGSCAHSPAQCSSIENSRIGRSATGAKLSSDESEGFPLE